MQFSDLINIEDLIKMPSESGRTILHNTNLYTFFRKQPGKMKNTFDFMLLPPLSIKNSLPCSFEIMKS
jgi:hypothetical protein